MNRCRNCGTWRRKLNDGVCVEAARPVCQRRRAVRSTRDGNGQTWFHRKAAERLARAANKERSARA